MRWSSPRTTVLIVGVRIRELEQKRCCLGGTERAGNQRKDESREIGEHDPGNEFGRRVRSFVCGLHHSLSKALIMKLG